MKKLDKWNEIQGRNEVFWFLNSLQDGTKEKSWILFIYKLYQFKVDYSKEIETRFEISEWLSFKHHNFSLSEATMFCESSNEWYFEALWNHHKF